MSSKVFPVAASNANGMTSAFLRDLQVGFRKRYGEFKDC
jgi:hypothetical protein